MKKNLVLAGALLFTIARTSAQQHPFARLKNHKNRALVQSVLNEQMPGNAVQKPTGIQQRVIAQGIESFLFESLDSVEYKYSGTRGSAFDYNYMDYSDGSGDRYDPIFRFPDELDPMSVLNDSLARYSDGYLYYTRYMHRRADDKIDTAVLNIDDGVGGNMAIGLFYTYNAQGLLTYRFNQQEISPGVTDTGTADRYVYNTAGTRLESDTTYLGLSGSLTAIGAVTYHYSSANRLDSATFWDLNNSTLILGSRIKFTYNTAGKISTLKSYNYENGAPQLSYADSIGYTNGADYFTFYQDDNYNEDGSYSDGFRIVKYVGANGLPDSVRTFDREGGAGSYDYLGTLHTSYNSFNNPDRFYYLMKGASGTVDTATRYSYYYETYDDGLSIKPLTENKEFNVYPNPFANNINIDWKGKAASEVTISLTNIVGRQMFRKDMKLNAGKNTIDIALLTNGTYLLQIRDASGKTWSTKLLKK